MSVLSEPNLALAKRSLPTGSTIGHALETVTGCLTRQGSMSE
jgi:hypothetical protein